MPEFEPIAGRYMHDHIDGERHRIFIEEAGRGLPLLCLHTAGNDSRQFRHVMNDDAITRRFRVIAFDLPYHGRSTPPDRWWLKRFRLTTKSYLAIIRAVWLALGLERPRARLLDGRRDRAQTRGQLSGRAFRHRWTGKLSLCAGPLQRFSASPGHSRRRVMRKLHLWTQFAVSPEENRRENWWYYGQSGPGIYQGDVYFYSNDWDAREDINDRYRALQVALFTGEYDYSCTPAMTEAVAGKFPVPVTLMSGMGHFPMIENYPDFRPYLLPGARAHACAKMKAARPSLRSRRICSHVVASGDYFIAQCAVGGARPLRVDRDRHAVLPLDDHQRRVDTAALVVELDVAAGEVLGRALAVSMARIASATLWRSATPAFSTASLRIQTWP